MPIPLACGSAVSWVWRSLTPSFIKKTYEHLKKLYDKRRGSSWGCAINIQYTTDGTFSYIHRFQYSKFSRLLSKKRISKYAFSWLTGYSPLYRASNQRAKITNNQWKQRRICPKSHKILLNFFNLRIRTGEIQKNTINLQKYLKPPCQWMRHKYHKQDKYKEKV